MCWRGYKYRRPSSNKVGCDRKSIGVLINVFLCFSRKMAKIGLKTRVRCEKSIGGWLRGKIKGRMAQNTS